MVSSGIHFSHGKQHDVLLLNPFDQHARTDYDFNLECLAYLYNPPPVEPQMQYYGPYTSTVMWQLYGAIDWTHMHHEQTYGNGDRTGSRNLIAEAMYNFNQESQLRPAIALSGRLDVPTGLSSTGLDTHARFLATKTIPYTSLFQRVHVNVSWVRNSDPMSDERQNRYIAIVGYSARVARATVFVADYVREQQRRKGYDSNIVELGIRQIINPLTVLALGVGAGIAEDSPEMRVTIGLQYSF
ncbi:MAG: hypothetical protein UZ03_NOB001002743 [Nitrospira sp. OLB3]|nr:MAG: hypothetical protein UZ03_NOB001002743 [Nitrospira sp. OLB3]